MDDILSKVQEILGDPQKLEGFKNLAASVLNNDKNIDNTKSSDDNVKNMPDIEGILKNFVSNKGSDNSDSYNTDQFNIPINLDMILKLQNAISLINQDDKNIAFLRSLKLLLGDEEKQQKVDSAIKIIRLIKLLPLIKDLNLLKDFKII